MKRQHKPLLFAAATGLTLVACSSTPKVEELDQARAVVQQVEASPDAGKYAVAELTSAHDAIREGDRLTKAKKSAEDVRQQAYLAQRYADTARQQIARGQAEAQAGKAEEERQRVLLQAREQEAAQARAQADEQAKNAAALQEQLRDLQARQTDRGLVLTLGDVLFDTGQATLKPGANSTVDRLGEFLQRSPERSVTIEGHTDSVGSDSYNQALSESRADAVKSALVSRGIPAQQIVAVGKGEAVPVASNDNAAGRQQNRRVEIIVSNPVAATAQPR
jgi:outer membrane protein OmpA-like peptidoglycan-associated protein